MAQPEDERLVVDAGRAVWREVGEEVVVLDVQSGTYLTLNGAGCLLWQRLDAGATPAELRRALTDTYEVEEEQAAADVDEFLAALVERELIKRD